jgi:hypothetical protein
MSPLVRRIDLTRSILRSNPPVATGDTALIYVKGDHRFLAERDLTASEIWFNPPRTAYLVDVAIHSIAIQTKLPSKVEAFSFDAAISVGWQVGSPLVAIDQNFDDDAAVVTAIVRPLLEKKLRTLSRQHAIEDSAGAERTINEWFSDRVFELDQGLVVKRCLATLSLDKEAQIHIANEKRAEWAGKQRVLQHKSIIKNAELGRVESMEEHQLETLQTKHRLDLDSQNHRHELEMKKLTMEFYADLLEQGQVGLLKARLEQHPDDIDSVLNFFLKEKQITFENNRTLWEMAVNRGLVSPTQVTGLVDQLTTGIVEPFASEQKAQLGDGVQHAAGQHADTVDGEVVEESVKVVDLATKDDDDDNPI